MPNEWVTIADKPSKCFLMSVGSACTKMRIAGERLSMTTLSTRQLQPFAAKHTQHGDQRREILLGQAKDGAVGQRQLDPGTALRRRDRQLQEVRRAWRRRGPDKRIAKRAARRDRGTSPSGTLQPRVRTRFTPPT